MKNRRIDHIKTAIVVVAIAILVMIVTIVETQSAVLPATVGKLISDCKVHEGSNYMGLEICELIRQNELNAKNKDEKEYYRKLRETYLLRLCKVR